MENIVLPLPQTQDASAALKAIIVDDEQDACKNLMNILTEYVDKNIEILSLAHNTTEAEIAINQFMPDVVFLDIEMPNENAFSFLERIAPFDFEIIFVTAFDAYAVRAFKLNAIDYILKPINISELAHAVVKVKEKIRFKKMAQTHTEIDFNGLAKKIQTRIKQYQITLRDNNYIEVVDFKDILFIEAKGSYSKIYFLSGNVEKSITMSYSIAEYEELLPDDMYYRIHKSYLVNCMHIKKVMKEEENMTVLVKDTYKLSIGRRRYTSFMSFLKNNAFYSA
jgi:two-component system LytT family response regulator